MNVRLLLLALPAAIACGVFAAPTAVTFAQSSAVVEAYDFIEVTAHVDSPDVANPFTAASLTGFFARSGSPERVAIQGFCDSADGSVFRIRFMPSSPGEYTYSLTYSQSGLQKTFSGKFSVTDAHRRGPIRVDPSHPWHFVWEGTGEHYFFNGTTAYWITGWRDERIIQFSLERLHELKINRIRTLLGGRVNTMYGEPVMNTEEFSVFLSPWPAEKADDFYHPGFDYSRFNVAHWQKYERMLRWARERDIDRFGDLRYRRWAHSYGGRERR